MLRPFPVLAGLLAALAAALGPGTSIATADWSPATTLAQHSSTVALLGLDYARDGTGVAAWTAASGGGVATQTATRPNGGAWTRPRTIGVAGVQPGAVAALGSGRVAMLGIVMANRGATARVIGYLLTTDGKLVKRTTLATGPYANVVRWGGVALDGDGAGKGVAVIGMRDSGMYVSRVNASSGFSTPKRLAKASFRIPAVAVGGRSTVAVAWNDGTHERAMLSSDGGKCPIEVAFDGNGDPLVVWLGRVLDRSLSPAVQPIVLAAEAQPSGPARPQRLSAGFGRPASLVGGAGSSATVALVVMGATPNVTTVAVDASLRNPGGGFGAVERVNGNADAMLAYRRDGTLTALSATSATPRDNAVLVADRP
jgi:hypothetical protein